MFTVFKPRRGKPCFITLHSRHCSTFCQRRHLSSPHLVVPSNFDRGISAFKSGPSFVVSGQAFPVHSRKMNFVKMAVVWVLLLVLALQVVFTFPQSYEYNHVKIHVPVFKHTRLHTRTLVKKVPVPVPVPVPIHHKEDHHTFHWPEKSYGRGSYYDRDNDD